MLLIALVRRSPALWLSPVLLFLIVFFANESLQPAARDYPLALTVTGASEVFLIAPFCAACAAWEGGRIRRAGWIRFPRTRTVVSFTLLALAPTLVVGLATTIFAVLYQFRVAPALALPDLTVLGVACVLVIAHTILGFAIGLHVRPVIAAPSILLVDYAWMVMPMGLYPLWLRHLTGSWTGCCDVTTSLDARALLAVSLVALGLVGTALLLLRVPLSVGRLGFAVAPIILAFSAGVWVVHPLGADPIVPRSGALVCSDGIPKICVWPEHRAELTHLASLAGHAVATWHDVGVAIPDRYSEERASALPPDAGSIRVRPDLGGNDTAVMLSLAYGALPRPPKCATAGAAPWPGGAAAPYVAVWLTNVAGVPLADLHGRISPDVINTVAAVRATPSAEQVTWVERNLTAIRDCYALPQLEPPS
jgi:hypothetical protein